ncbi:hypothetical protein CH379_001635 [Leptospira ellisii]|uniref:Uncharacterized protein n=1 Tax=Leptospira ellisii TaxID=2023197 RepID=A0AAE4QKU1_9LEPT|nr:hypothetical protein [Leptospira ellisii]MDV6234331.1 hypothetical protein [Leptospira ellisii]
MAQPATDEEHGRICGAPGSFGPPGFPSFPPSETRTKGAKDKTGSEPLESSFANAVIPGQAVQDDKYDAQKKLQKTNKILRRNS